jgi:TetR/AcrR family transcriptional repressor of bet genes
MTRQPPRFTRLPAADRRKSLIEASLACMAQGGIAAFTVDRVCQRAGVSRGLITHHFGSMSGLMAAVYAHLYTETIPSAAALPEGEARLTALVDALFDPHFFNRPALNVWLALWGAISNTPDLTQEHRKQYGLYVRMVAGILAERASSRGRTIEPETLARSFISLVDGLSLQHCIDPPSMPALVARQACLDFLKLHLGPAP